VIIPAIVVNFPIFFDFVQPAIEIIVSRDIIPKKNADDPISLGSNKSLARTLLGYPLVVIITIFVIAKTLIRNKQADKVDANIILLVNRVFVSCIKKFAIIDIENPPSNELIVIIWLASLL